ncbi:unnamed protein product [Brassicogethes aeneus]|uniref:Crossover junction endonuclease EME1 n=1 Tax=Brassicogethes aeneus TaxID=1431903 RepID=A0A9P0B7Z3_BRAAE|nr:unnamed protein product [Brassicogethes aeneus]
MDEIIELDSSDETIVLNPSEIANLDNDSNSTEQTDDLLSEADLILKKYTSDLKPGSSAFSSQSNFNEFSDDEPSSKKTRNSNDCDEIMRQLNSEDNIFKEFAKKYKKKEDVPSTHTGLYDKPILLNKELEENFDQDTDFLTKTDDDLEAADLLMKEIYAKYNLGSINSKTSSSKSSIEEQGGNKLKGKKPLSKNEKALEREAAKVVRMQKKDELAREKRNKEALRMLEKNINPSECLKFITVNFDDEIFQQPYWNVIINTLQNANVSFTKIAQPIPKLISWTRKTNFIEKEKLISKDIEEQHLLLLMDSKDFLIHIKEKTLTIFIQSIHSLFTEKKQLSLGVYGLAQYFKFKKNKEKSDFQSAIRETESKMPNGFKDFPKVDRKTVEFALAELQLFCLCYFRALESHDDVSVFIMECTKSVAKKPYKLKKQESYQQETEWFQGDKKDCIRVDKHGNGLSRLWTQVLTMFPLARLETAEAISSLYSNPKALFEAYDNSQSEQEKEQLLQELRVRRAAGPNTSFRKIGPEMSKKASNFFNSQENVLL